MAAAAVLAESRTTDVWGPLDREWEREHKCAAVCVVGQPAGPRGARACVQGEGGGGPLLGCMPG